MERKPFRTEYLPFAKPDLNERDIQAVVEALQSGWLSKGPKVLEFEKVLGEHLGAEHVVTCNSGTAALHLAMLAAEIGPEDEVIAPSFTFAATVNVILHVGATPVFVDISEETLCLDVEEVHRKISPRTKAVMAVHYGGHAADLQALKRLCVEYNLLLIEDAAHAIGTKYEGHPIGTYGDLVCFSFYATKNITTTEGGALVAKSEEMAERARLYGWHGITKNAWNRYSKSGSWRYDILLPGFKYNMTDPQAALGLTQMERMEEMTAKRTALAQYYLKELAQLGDCIVLPEQPQEAGHVHSWHLFPIRITPKFGIDRDRFVELMGEMKIGTSVHYIPVHMHPYYKERFDVILPVTEKVFSEVVSLPLYSRMAMDDARDVVHTMLALAEANVI